ncbi:DUF6809 family protein [Anaerosporobacter sp.]|uniref:DUF6809 family protein n=1 Tax=Anaerosporobacter sp. TaxID=1872529 RepID=UPI00286FAEBE|nr:DUF6809 family protein [Anaerosporobacter sp.]
MNRKIIDDTLLEKLFSDRLSHALELTLNTDKDYQKAVREEDIMYKKLEKVKLSKKQKKKVENVISANNACGAAYGNVAYRQGFHDAVKLIAELSEFI